jgi:hypothetical protein
MNIHMSAVLLAPVAICAYCVVQVCLDVRRKKPVMVVAGALCALVAGTFILTLAQSAVR